MSVKPITAKEADQIFKYWASGPNGQKRPMAKVCKRFKRGRSTIYRLKRRENWDQRYADIIAKTRQATDHQVGKQEIKTRDILTATLHKIAKAVLNKDYQPQITDLEGFEKLIGRMTPVARLLSELEENLPPEGSHATYILQALNDGNLATISNEELAHQLRQHSIFVDRRRQHRQG